MEPEEEPLGVEEATKKEDTDEPEEELVEIFVDEVEPEVVETPEEEPEPEPQALTPPLPYYVTGVLEYGDLTIPSNK